MASFSSFAGRNATFLLGAICNVAPVAGLRPVRASRLRTSSVPRPFILIRSPCLRWLVTLSTIPVSSSCACFLGTFWSCASCSKIPFNITVEAEVPLPDIRDSL